MRKLADPLAIAVMLAAVAAGWFVPMAFGSDWMWEHKRATGPLLVIAALVVLGAVRRDRRSG